MTGHCYKHLNRSKPIVILLAISINKGCSVETMGLKIGIIGCGAIAGIHVRGYRQAEDVEIVACSDLLADRASTFAKTHSIPLSYDSYETMLETEKLDAVSICTPNYAHCGPTLLALQAGVHVLCEKPIAMNAEEAHLMVEAAHCSSGLLTIGHHMRFLPASRYLKQMIDDGDLGKIYFGKSQALRRRGVPGWGQFHIKSKSGGGPLIDLGVHTLDLITWLMGSPQPTVVSGSVYTKLGNQSHFYNPHGTYRREDYDVEDFAAGLIKFSNGATLTLEASWAAHLPQTETYEQTLLGDAGGATINPFVEADQSLRVYMSRGEALLDVKPHAFATVEAHIEELKHWVKCIRGEAAVLVKPEESLNVQRIIDSLYVSSDSGREVVLETQHNICSSETASKVEPILAAK